MSSTLLCSPVVYCILQYIALLSSVVTAIYCSQLYSIIVYLRLHFLGFGNLSTGDIWFLMVNDCEHCHNVR